MMANQTVNAKLKTSTVKENAIATIQMERLKLIHLVMMRVKVSIEIMMLMAKSIKMGLILMVIQILTYSVTMTYYATAKKISTYL